MIPGLDQKLQNRQTVEPFLLDSASKAFLTDEYRSILYSRFRREQERIQFILAGCALMILFPSLGLQVVALTRPAVPQPSLQGLVCTVALIVGCVYLLVSKVTTIKAKERLVHDGEVLNGSITRCSGSMRTVAAEGGAGEKVYFVKIQYRFVSPQGREIMSHWERDRDDLVNFRLPAEGTAVLVLYLNDNNYALL